MGATFSRVKTWSNGEILTHTDLNAEFDSVLNNLTPAGVDDASANTAAMQGTTDPYPGSVESLATSLTGELERIRYLIKQITGKSQWYIDPDSSLAAVIPSGTKMSFYQASPPTGWTAVAVNDKFIRVVTSGGTGGTTGGSVAASTSLAHTHTVNSHTHTGPSHTHTTPNHTHDLIHSSGTVNVGNTPTAILSNDANNIMAAFGGTINNVAGRNNIQSTTETSGAGTTGADGTGVTGGTAPGTDSQLGAFAYADFCVGTKD